jgi:hypothetical protein
VHSICTAVVACCCADVSLDLFLAAPSFANQAALQHTQVFCIALHVPEVLICADRRSSKALLCYTGLAPTDICAYAAWHLWFVCEKSYQLLPLQYIVLVLCLLGSLVASQAYASGEVEQPF